MIDRRCYYCPNCSREVVLRIDIETMNASLDLPGECASPDDCVGTAGAEFEIEIYDLEPVNLQ